jgi:hypothetical protein
MAFKGVKHNILAVEPAVMTTTDGKGLTIRAEIVEMKLGQSKRTGKYIHLSVTPSDGMNLLALLKQAQSRCGWPDAPPPQPAIHVPPPGEKN